MERKSKQKIGIISILTVSAILEVIAFFCNNMYQKNLLVEQGRELSAIYPEFAEGLNDNAAYYWLKSMHMNQMVFIAITIIAVLAVTALYILLRQEPVHISKEKESELELIYEQILNLQNGKEVVIPPPGALGSRKTEAVMERLKELEYYCTNLKERLEIEENSTKELITDISHQLKTPLASIKMSHDLSLTSEFTQEERQSYTEAETQEIQKMEMLLDELVKLSRLEKSMIQIKCEKNRIKDTISEAVSQVYIKACTKHIEICVETEDDAYTMHDPKWTAEALANILENAIKYSDHDTVIRINVSRLTSYVLIQIEDQGIGIPEDEIHQVFKRFYRGSNAKQISKDGAGVGLYLSRKIIEQQGGSIVAKGKREKGTVFRIMLPLPEN